MMKQGNSLSWLHEKMNFTFKQTLPKENIHEMEENKSYKNFLFYAHTHIHTQKKSCIKGIWFSFPFFGCLFPDVVKMLRK